MKITVNLNYPILIFVEHIPRIVIDREQQAFVLSLVQHM